MTIDDLNEYVATAPRDHEVLVPASDPVGVPYSKPVVVPKADVTSRKALGYREITSGKRNDMLGEVEDYTADWKHSE